MSPSRVSTGAFRIALLVTFLVAAGWAVDGEPASPATVGHLRVEYEEMPLGIDARAPRFGWQMQAPEGSRGDSQSAYRIVVTSPDGGTGYDRADREAGGNGYVPISLQYGRYTAEHARATSLAGGDPLEGFTNRSYRGKTVTAVNASDLALIRDTRKAMAGKPVVVSVALSNPTVFREIEKEADAILVTFGVQDQAVLDVLSGTVEPQGLLPLQMPADMRTVEEQKEDVPRDMRCHVDSEGHNYDFGFGLGWSGVIDDARTARYAR